MAKWSNTALLPSTVKGDNTTASNLPLHPDQEKTALARGSVTAPSEVFGMRLAASKTKRFRTLSAKVRAAIATAKVAPATTTPKNNSLLRIARLKLQVQSPLRDSSAPSATEVSFDVAKALNSTEDAQIKAMSTFEADEHLHGLTPSSLRERLARRF